VTPNEIQHSRSDAPHLAKHSLDTLLSDTDVRLCFGEVDYVIINLEGCYTLVDLIASIRLNLQEELGNEHIRFIEVAQETDQEFRVKNKTLKRLRLLPGPGRERSYENFLCLLRSAPPRGESHSFKMFVHVKGTREV
jgi:hypothetical protein